MSLQETKRPVDPAKLRARMARAVEKLIDALDAFDAVDEDLEDGDIDDDDDREDGGDDEFSFNGDEPELDKCDDEPSLGSDDWAINQQRWNNLPPQPRGDLWAACPIDREQDQDAEPTLGWANQGSQAGLNTLLTDGETECSLAVTGHINQSIAWSERGGDPWVDREHDESDLEPSLGWTVVGSTMGGGDDREWDDGEHGIADFDALVATFGGIPLNLNIDGRTVRRSVIPCAPSARSA